MLSVYPFGADMTKLLVTNIMLTDILPRKAIAAIQVRQIQFKPTSSSVSISQA